MPSAHAKYAPSSMKRIKNCPGSVQAQEAAGKSEQGTVFTRKGTAAHAMGERCLKTGEDIWEFEGQVIDMDGNVLDGVEADESYTFLVDGELAEGIELYLETIRDIVEGFAGTMETWVEERVEMTHIDPDFWGTGDWVGYTPLFRHLVVVDYKNGHVPVEVGSNEQALSYGSGARRKLLAMGCAIDSIELVIVQPHAEHPDGPVRRHHATVEELDDFELDAAVAIQAAKEPDAPRKGGSWCMFCSAMGDCAAYRTYLQETTGLAFETVADEDLELPPVGTLTPDQTARLWTMRKELIGWLEQVKKHILRQADGGLVPTGMKLVDTRVTRRWRAGVEATTAGLELAGLSKEDFTVKRLISPAGLEKRLGKRRAAPVLEGLVVNNLASRTLVPLSDKRPSVTPGSNFSTVED